MKNSYFFLGMFFLSLNGIAQIITIPDANFRALLLSSTSSNTIARNSIGWAIAIDTNNDGQIQLSEALNIAQINVSSNPYNTTNDIHDLSGIENFTNLKVLNCSGNQISSINIATFTQLEEINASYNLITSFSFSGITTLKKLNFDHNSLTTLNTDNLINLTELFVYDNDLTSISFNNNPLLQNLRIEYNSLTSLNLSVLPSLTWASCESNNLMSLNLSGLTALRSIRFESNQINSIDLSNLTALEYLTCSNNPLNAINVNGLVNLSNLDVSNTPVTTIDCSQSGVNVLFAQNCPNLQTINVRNGVYSYSDPDLLFYAFRIENNPQLLSICTDNGEQNQLAFTNYNTSGSVIVYNGANCDIPVMVNMGVLDFDKSILKIYPNPTSDIVNIVISNNEPILRTMVNNVLGQTIMAFENNTVIDISSLTNGTYFITIETALGKETQKIIKL